MEVRFDQQITIGRDVFNSLSLQDPEVSRSHAIIFEQDGETTIKDLKSRNGIFVGGEKVTEGTLKPGDEIILGTTVVIFEPSDTLDLGQSLSKRGKYLIEKRTTPQAAKRILAPETVFTLEQMDSAVESLFLDPEKTSYFTISHALLLLQAIKEMDAAKDAASLFEIALRRALANLGGHRGVIMEVDESRKHLKARSIISSENTSTIMIAQPVLRVVVGAEKCIQCPATTKDKRFEQAAARSKRPIYSFMATPIGSHKDLFGFIYLESENESVSYDYAALRSLYFIAHHLGALLRGRPVHFHKHAQVATSIHLTP
jgi:pSer/pThr/pTyr-binding forkhead associated (FHA) protein